LPELGDQRLGSCCCVGFFRVVDVFSSSFPCARGVSFSFYSYLLFARYFAWLDFLQKSLL